MLIVILSDKATENWKNKAGLQSASLCATSVTWHRLYTVVKRKDFLFKVSIDLKIKWGLFDESRYSLLFKKS